MTGWTGIAMVAVAVCVLVWFPPPALGRLRTRPVPVTEAAPRHGAFVLAGAVAAMVVGWLFLPAGGWWVLPVVAIPGGIIGHQVGRRLPSRAARVASRQRTADLAPALDLLATCLQAGLPLTRATEAVHDAMAGPVRADLLRVMQHIDIGSSEAEAWRTLSGVPAWRAVARDIGRAAESGTGLVDLLHRAATEARETQHAHLVAHARTAGVRSVLPLMTCFLPAFLLVGIVPIIGAAIVRLLG